MALGRYLSGLGLYLYKTEAVEAWLLLAEKVLEKDSTKQQVSREEIDEMLGNIATIRALIASRKGDCLTVTKYAPKALELLPYEIKKVRGLVLYTIGTDHYMSLHFDKAVETYDEAYDLLLQDRNLAGCVIVALKRGEILHGQGKLHELKRYIRNRLN